VNDLEQAQRRGWRVYTRGRELIAEKEDPSRRTFFDQYRIDFEEDTLEERLDLVLDEIERFEAKLLARRGQSSQLQDERPT
jgi:hypothetical protein